MSYDCFIENFKNTLCMDCLLIVPFPLLKQHTPGVRNVIPSRLQTFCPLADSSVNNTLLQTAPNVNQSPLRLVDIVDLHLTHAAA